MRMAPFLGLLTVAVAVATVPQAFSEEPAPSVLTLELNSLQPSDKGCRLTFVVSNRLGAELTKAAFEIALFNEAGIVDRLTVLDFNELPAGKTKVARFDLAGADCGKISRVLINHATECVGAGIEPDACQRRLKPETKSGIAFGM
jgi:hypothetical protein